MPGSSSKHILVLGGGVAGAAAAKILAEAGQEVTLIEKQPWIGGQTISMGCKATDTCLHCNVCLAIDAFKSLLLTPGIRLITGARLVAWEANQQSSKYQATIAWPLAHINLERCSGCGACLPACPQDCFQIRWPAVYGAKPVMLAEACLRARGQNCKRCAQICPTDAIVWNKQSQRLDLEVDALLVASGYQPFDPASDASWGYGTVPNVITALELEQQLGRNQKMNLPGAPARPSRVAFIQCVGSRSEQVQRRPHDTDYCSAVCCAYALRLARRLLHEAPNTQISVFYMDIQNFGKGFNSFLRATANRINLICSRPYEVSAGPGATVMLSYEDQERAAPTQTEFDLVVLSIGIRPASDATALAEMLRIPVDEQGFLGNKGVAGLPSSDWPKLFLAGTCGMPQDIASTINQAEAACAAILNGSPA